MHRNTQNVSKSQPTSSRHQSCNRRSPTHDHRKSSLESAIADSRIKGSLDPRANKRSEQTADGPRERSFPLKCRILENFDRPNRLRAFFRTRAAPHSALLETLLFANPTTTTAMLVHEWRAGEKQLLCKTHLAEFAEARRRVLSAVRLSNRTDCPAGENIC